MSQAPGQLAFWKMLLVPLYQDENVHLPECFRLSIHRWWLLCPGSLLGKSGNLCLVWTTVYAKVLRSAWLADPWVGGNTARGGANPRGLSFSDPLPWEGAIFVPLELCPGGGLTTMKEEDSDHEQPLKTNISKLCRKCDYVLIMQVIFMHLQIPSNFINLFQLEWGGC